MVRLSGLLDFYKKFFQQYAKYTLSGPENQAVINAINAPTALNRLLELRPIGGEYKKHIVCVDTGAACSLVNASSPIASKSSLVQESSIQLTGAFGGTVEMVGCVDLELKVNNKNERVRFTVVKDAIFSILLSWPDIQRLKLVITSEGIFKNQKEIGSPVRNVNVIQMKNAVFVDYPVLNVSQPQQSMLIDPTEISCEDGVYELPKIQAAPDIENQIRSLFEKGIFGISKKLNEDQQNQILNEMIKYKSIFAETSTTIGKLPSSVGTFKQEFIDDPPVAKIWPTDLTKQKLIHAEVEKMVKMGVLKPSKSGVITANLLAVPKKGTKELRIVIDLRAVNKITKANNLVLPRLDDILNDLNGHRFYMALDVAKAFWCVAVPEEDRKYYTCHDPLNRMVYEFVRMPMGAKNASQIFQMLAETVIRPKTIGLSVYIDDLSGACDTFEEGMASLKTLFARVKEANLKLGLKKSKLFCEELTMFGYKLTRKGYAADPDRVKALISIAAPKNQKELLSIIASFNYFRSTIPNFAKIAAPMYKLTGSKVKFEWSFFY